MNKIKFVSIFLMFALLLSIGACEAKTVTTTATVMQTRTNNVTTTITVPTTTTMDKTIIATVTVTITPTTSKTSSTTSTTSQSTSGTITTSSTALPLTTVTDTSMQILTPSGNVRLDRFRLGGTDTNSPWLRGYAKNLTNGVYDVYITAAFIDASGKIVATKSITILNLTGNTEKQFLIEVNATGVTGFAISAYEDKGYN